MLEHSLPHPMVEGLCTVATAAGPDRQNGKKWAVLASRGNTVEKFSPYQSKIEMFYNLGDQ